MGVQTAYAAISSFNVTINADANGLADFTNLPPGTYIFTVSYNGHTMRSQGVEIATNGSSNITVILPSSGGNIQAVVKDGSGTAISGATVKVLSGATTVATGTTDSNGVAVIGGIAAGSYTISAAKTGYICNASPNVNVIEGQTASATVTMTSQTGSVTASVSFSDGATNVTPSFYVDGSATAYMNVTGSPATGYTLTGLTTNVAHTIKVSAANYTSSTDSAALSVTPSSTGTVNAGSVTLTRQTGNANITVYDDSGTISGAIVSVTVNGITLTVPTNSFGVATFSDIPTGSYSFTASKLGYSSVSSVSVNITNGNTATAAINLNMQTFTITATVTGGTGGTITPAGGSPIPTSGTTSVNYGSSQAYTITADSGHIISGIFIDGSSTSQTITATGLAGQQSYTFNSVIGAHTISATFAPAYAIAATAGTGGTISPSGSIVVTSGGSQTYTITADSSHIISGIFIDGSSTSQTITATGSGGSQQYVFSSVTSTHTIQATFTSNTLITLTTAHGSLLGGAQVYISDTNGHSTTTCISNTAGQVWIDTSAITGPATAHIVFSTYSGTMPVTTGPSANTVIIPMDVSCQVQPSIHPPSFIQITTGTYTITSTPATGFNFELPHNDSTQYNIRFSPGSYLAISTDPGDTNPLAVLTQGGTLSAYILLSYSSIYCATNYLTAY